MVAASWKAVAGGGRSQLEGSSGRWSQAAGRQKQAAGGRSGRSREPVQEQGQAAVSKSRRLSRKLPYNAISKTGARNRVANKGCKLTHSKNKLNM